jgi:hypothetical protein
MYAHAMYDGQLYLLPLPRRRLIYVANISKEVASFYKDGILYPVPG